MRNVGRPFLGSCSFCSNHSDSIIRTNPLSRSGRTYSIGRLGQEKSRGLDKTGSNARQWYRSYTKAVGDNGMESFSFALLVPYIGETTSF